MALFGKKDAELEILGKISTSLERLAILYELDLISRGVVTRTDEGEGEVLDTDPDTIERLESEEELKKKYGLPPGTKLGAGGPSGDGWRPGDVNPSDFGDQPPSLWYPSGLSFPTGPEGSEETEPSA